MPGTAIVGACTVMDDALGQAIAEVTRDDALAEAIAELSNEDRAAFAGRLRVLLVTQAASTGDADDIVVTDLGN